MDWQEWIVAAIGVVVVVYLLRRLVCMVRGGGAGCEGCSADCPLKNRKK